MTKGVVVEVYVEMILMQKMLLLLLWLLSSSIIEGFTGVGIAASTFTGSTNHHSTIQAIWKTFYFTINS
jgi:hypothetical protein